MSVDGLTGVSRGMRDSAFVGRLRVGALLAVLAGAGGSLGLMLRAGRQNPSRLLMLLMAIWVLSPFVALAWAHLVSKRWSVLTRTTLYGVTLALTLCSLALYLNVVVSPPRAQAAFVFVVVPPASWLVIATVVPIAALISSRMSRQADDA